MRLNSKIDKTIKQMTGLLFHAYRNTLTQASYSLQYEKMPKVKRK